MDRDAILREMIHHIKHSLLLVLGMGLMLGALLRISTPYWNWKLKLSVMVVTLGIILFVKLNKYKEPRE